VDFSSFCGSGSVEFLLDLFVRTRLYYTLKYMNSKLLIQDQARKRKNRKAKKVTHS